MIGESPEWRRALRVLVARAADATGRGDTVEAVRCLREGVRLAPSDALLWTQYGAALRDSGETQSALEALQKAVELDPSCAAAWSQFGTTLLEDGQLEAAEDALRCALVLKPRAHRWVLLAAVQEQLEDCAAARESLEEALRIAPDYDEALHKLGVFLRLEDPHRALELLERAAQLDPANGPTFREMGFVLAQLGETKRALQTLRTAIELNPTDFWNHIYCAAVYEDLKDNVAAEACYEQAATCAPVEADAYSLWGEFYRRTGRLMEAADKFRQALTLEPFQGLYMFKLGRCLVESGRLEEGCSWLRRAQQTQLSPKDRAQIDELLEDV